ncbi:hypothetical protein [Streptomonospora salina]|uniref:Uncharacterized protein n=1 Tax=Streptomonospora salina TaxID=104205 RepID=A0A841EDA6_9ACTN|nr:hypothetical protein [Streptomonospora salina]MBB5998440.1 hypothetical protein [Streptomonospora salina]
MLSQPRSVCAAFRRRHRAARRCERGSYTTELIIGITIVVAITAVVGPILIDTFTDAAKNIDLGVGE